MVLDLIANVFFSVLDVLRGALFFSVIVFFLVLIARFLSKKINEKVKFPWIQTSLISTYLVVFCLVLVLYFYPMYLGFSEQNMGEIPKDLQMNSGDWFNVIGGGLVRVALLSALFSVFLLPLEFVGVFLLEKVKEKFKLPELANIFASVFGSTLLALFIVLFVFPWIFTSFFYLIYFA